MRVSLQKHPAYARTSLWMTERGLQGGTGTVSRKRTGCTVDWRRLDRATRWDMCKQLQLAGIFVLQNNVRVLGCELPSSSYSMHIYEHCIYLNAGTFCVQTAVLPAFQVQGAAIPLQRALASACELGSPNNWQLLHRRDQIEGLGSQIRYSRDRSTGLLRTPNDESS